MSPIRIFSGHTGFDYKAYNLPTEMTLRWPETEVVSFIEVQEGLSLQPIANKLLNIQKL